MVLKSGKYDNEKNGLKIWRSSECGHYKLFGNFTNAHCWIFSRSDWKFGVLSKMYVSDDDLKTFKESVDLNYTRKSTQIRIILDPILKSGDKLPLFLLGPDYIHPFFLRISSFLYLSESTSVCLQSNYAINLSSLIETMWPFQLNCQLSIYRRYPFSIGIISYFQFLLVRLFISIMLFVIFRFAN